MARSESASAKSKVFRILLVEDNLVNQKVILRQLQLLGYSADRAANGLEALESLSKAEYDIVLMDCQMPEMDGYEATREIRRREADLRRTTIIAMTDNPAESNRELCIQSGMDDYIHKPARQEDLKSMLERWMGQKREEAAEVDRTNDECNLARVIDADVINGLRSLTAGTQPDFLIELIDLFIEDAPGRIAQMRDAVANDDAAAVERAAHALKSSSLNLGARRMHALCEIIEERVSRSPQRIASTLIATLEEEFARVRRALEAEKKKQP
jgi:CheY-like chemotaxis protein/HPt (histidine-containing phosphotransfer) domain-containing protein